MQKGSLVEFISIKGYTDVTIYLKTPYTVKDIKSCGCGCGASVVYLEEVTRSKNPFGDEYGFNKKDLKEIQPPIDITSIVEEAITDEVLC